MILLLQVRVLDVSLDVLLAAIRHAVDTHRACPAARWQLLEAVLYRLAAGFAFPTACTRQALKANDSTRGKVQLDVTNIMDVIRRLSEFYKSHTSVILTLQASIHWDYTYWEAALPRE